MSVLPDSAPGMQASQVPDINGVSALDESAVPIAPARRKRIVVIGLGMVGIAFM